VMFIDWGDVLTSIGCSRSTLQQLVSISVAWYADLISLFYCLCAEQIS
jgi:hypothetical protein